MISSNDATRILDVIDSRVRELTRSMAKVETTWGDVQAVATDGKTCDVFLYGETDPEFVSEGFRVPHLMAVAVGDVVKVAINYATGERWIEEVYFPATAYKKIAVDIKTGTLLLGDGAGAGDTAIHRVAANHLRIGAQSSGPGRLTLGDTDTGSDLGTTSLTIGIERPWVFEQGSTGAGAILQLRPIVSDKAFRVIAQDGGEAPLSVNARNAGNGSRVTIGSGTFLAGGGTAFPATPSVNDRYFRTDHGLEYFYNGTRWLSTTRYHLPITPNDLPITASSTNDLRAAVPPFIGSDIWMERLATAYYVDGGTALSGSHKWDVTFRAFRIDSATSDTFYTGLSINSGASSVWRQNDGSVGSLLNASFTHVAWETMLTKTGTPGNLYILQTLTYRLVAT